MIPGTLEAEAKPLDETECMQQRRKKQTQAPWEPKKAPPKKPAKRS